jgi:hypothetical protein
MYKRNHAGERPDLGNFLTTKRSTALMTIRATIPTTANVRCIINVHVSDGR